MGDEIKNDIEKTDYMNLFHLYLLTHLSKDCRISYILCYFFKVYLSIFIATV